MKNLEQYDTALIIAHHNKKSREVKDLSWPQVTKVDDWQDEKIQKLVSKFNNNIASIWDDKACPVDDKNYSLEENSKSSIWSFTYSTPQSSTTPSPKVFENNSSHIWQSDDQEQDLNLLQTQQSQNQFSNFWKPLNSTPINFPFSNLAANIDVNNWFAFTKGRENEPTPTNKTSLSNHRVNSLFVEVNSLKKKLTQESRNLQNLPFVESSLNHGASAIINRDKKPGNYENLLTSFETHFQPIRTDSLDSESDESVGSSDEELTRLVPCSSKCPNNELRNKCDNNLNDLSASLRPPSTSLLELASFMGPFSDPELIQNDGLNSSTNSAIPTHLASKSQSGFNFDEILSSNQESLIETSEPFNQQALNLKLIKKEEENEFEELSTLLNQVLREESTSQDEMNLKSIFYNSVCDECSKSHENEEQENTNRIDDNNEDENSPKISWPFWLSQQYQSKEEKTKSCNELNNLRSKITEKNQNIKNVLFSCNSEKLMCNNDNVISKVFDLENSFKQEELNDDLSGHQNSMNWFNLNNMAKDDENYDTLNEWSIDEYNCNIAASGDVIDPGQVYYSWDLEEEWQKEETNSHPLNLQVNHKTDIHGLSKRPCSFFLEGNCRRSDCKFSHDLKNITCKFWEESTCFKGHTCPFLHGYPKFENEANLEGANDNKYTIESESDFPSLATQEPDPFVVSEEIAKLKSKKKKETNVLFRMVKKKRRKGGQQSYNEKAV